MNDYRVGQHVTVKLSGGRLVDAEIKAIIETTGGIRLQVSFGEETARIYLWQVEELWLTQECCLGAGLDRFGFIGEGQRKKCCIMATLKVKVYYAHAMCTYGHSVEAALQGCIVNPARYDGHPKKLLDTLGFCLRLGDLSGFRPQSAAMANGACGFA